jgi:hypothetical protein
MSPCAIRLIVTVWPAMRLCSPSASNKYYACSRSGTRTERSGHCCTSPFEPQSSTARTSSANSTSLRAHNSYLTPWRTVCSKTEPFRSFGSHAKSALRMDVPRLRRAVDARAATGQSHRVKSCEPSGSQDFCVSKEIDLLPHDAHGWRSRWRSHSAPALNRRGVSPTQTAAARRRPCQRWRRELDGRWRV